MWSVVEKISQKQKKSAVIVTTHSMEETEALATKLGIMVRGGIFRCFGTIQHVKSKYGIGYEVEIKIVKPSYEQLKEFSDELGFGRDLTLKTDLTEAISKIRVNGFSANILDQVREDGVGKDLILEA